MSEPCSISPGPSQASGVDDPAGTPAAGFVREACAADLEAMGRVHAADMLASLDAAHAGAHGGAPLPEGVRAMVSPPVIAAGWEHAVEHPPSAEHRVLVATDGPAGSGAVVGLVGLAPTEAVSPEGAGDSEAPVQRGVELTALGVAPANQRRGHGSRLLAAATDYARAGGGEVLLVWTPRGDQAFTAFLSGAGLTLTGSRRELPVGLGVIEECWAAVL